MQLNRTFLLATALRAMALGAVTAAGVPLPAMAQNVPGDHRSVLEQRISGVWGKDQVRVSAWELDGQFYVSARITTASGRQHVLNSRDTRLTTSGEALEGAFQDVTRFNYEPGALGRWRLSMSGDRLRIEMLESDYYRISGSQLDRAPSHERPSPNAFERFTGSWRISYGGTMTLREEYKRLIGEYRLPDASGVNRLRKTFLFHPENVTSVEVEGDTISGTWQEVGSGGYHGGRAELTLTGAGLTFGGKLFDDPAHAIWRGTKQGESAPPTNSAPPSEPTPPTPPVVTPPPGPGGTPPSPGPVLSTSFKPLNRLDVRVDRVVVARGYPTYQVHAFVTVKNTSATPQYFTSGFMKLVLADADGAGWERSQPYRASGEPAELFSATPVIQPGGELKVRYIFTPEVDAQLTSLTFSEGGKTAEFPVGAL